MRDRISRRLSSAFLIMICIISSTWIPRAAQGAPVDQRRVLPTTVTPNHYRIDITPDADALTFKVSVQIDITVHQATRKIVLNDADIVIDQATLDDGTKVNSIDRDTDAQTATLALSHTLKPGAHTVSMTYHGTIYRQASGLFALDYETAQGKARALFTQFENSDARRFVPSWDEPGRKATFTLTATVPAGQMALSNMPIAATEVLPGNLKRVHFAATPRMSSYLLFFGVGDFERVNRDIEGVDVGVVVKRGDSAAAAFALDAAAHILPYYNDYFGTPFPLPKLDLIAAPGDSQFFGAMENWGAIFYFERDLLIDSRISTDLDKQGVYITVAHEMAHQWFGDLVTMAWWDDLWLNEGFASWMEYKVTDHFHPDWKIWMQGLHQSHRAMEIDSKDGTHPIITPIKDVLQASDAFDTITYSKGAAVIRMLESYVGETAFRDGVRRYMHDHAYGNTTTDDLWKEIDQGSSQPLTPIAHDFTLQAGVPEVTEVSSSCQADKTTLQVTQSHFAIDAGSTAARLWHVPVRTAHVGGPPSTDIVAGASRQTLRLAECGTTIINAGQTAYFRTRYSHDSMAAIAAHYAQLPPIDQLGVLDDTRALAYGGKEPMSALLDLTTHIPADADPLVASALVGVLLALDKLHDGLQTQTAFRAYAHRLLNPLFVRVGWDPRPGEEGNVALLRPRLIAALGAFQDTGVIDEARRRFDRYMIDKSDIDPGVRQAFLNVTAVHADQKTWDRLRGLAKDARTEVERQEYYEMLAVPESAELAQQALQLALSGEPPPTTGPNMLSAAAGRHPAMAFDFAVAHWETLSPFIEPASQPRFMPGILTDTSDLNLIAKLDAFAAGHIPPDARQDLRKTESNIRYLAKIREDQLPQVDEWIRKQGFRFGGDLGK
jgi:aminopeptidase N